MLQHGFTSPDDRIPSLRRRQLRTVLAQDWRGFRPSSRTLFLLQESLERGTAAHGCLLASPLLGGWVQDVLFWRETYEQAARLVARKSARARTRLFDRIARTEFLAEALPTGRLDARFERRVLRRARQELQARLEDLPRIVWPHFPRRRVTRLPFLLRENVDEGSPAGCVRLGLTSAVLAAQPPHASRILGEANGESLTFAGRVGLELLETVPASPLLVAHRLVSRADSLRVGGRVPGLARRLARALSLVDAAWPEAGEEIRRRTWLVVPLVEPGTVSYSHLARPGISYLSVYRGTLLDLADDLLHESAHHRLHAWQEVARFARDDPEQRYASPWRRGLRPLNGILHGTFTFLDRAELLLRVVSSGRIRSASRRSALRREGRAELARCADSLRELDRARKENKMTPAGIRLLRAMKRRHGNLAGGRLSGRGHFSIF